MRVTTPITRRRFLAATAAAGATASMGIDSRPVLAATRSQTVTLGKAEITVLSDGIFTLPLSFVLPDKPTADAEAYLASHGAKPEFIGETNVVLVRSGATLALIDTGGGTDFMPTLGRLPDALETTGIAAADVTHVIFTHAHADHLWGVTDPFTDETRWPNARHIMTATERDFWLAPDVESKVPDALKGMAIGSRRRLKTLADTLVAAKDGEGEEVAPGISLFATPGHTPGHASVSIRDGSDEMIIGGDALTHAVVSFEEPAWRWGSDFDGGQAIETRKRLLDRLATSKALFTGYHLPWPGIGHVDRNGASYRFAPHA